MKHKENTAKLFAEYVVNVMALNHPKVFDDPTMSQAMTTFLENAYLVGFNDSAIMHIDFVRSVVEEADKQGHFVPEVFRMLPIVMRKVGGMPK